VSKNGTPLSRPRTLLQAETPAALGRYRALRVVLALLVAYVLFRLLVGFGYELMVAAAATVLHLIVATGAWEPAIRVAGLDPIYAGAAIRAAGGVQVVGFAVAGPIGSALHAGLPIVFLPGDQVAGGAAISMVAAPGAPAIGRGLASFSADVTWLAIGLWVFWHWRHRDWRLALVGLVVQAQIAVKHLLYGHVALSDLDASGLPFALQVAIPNGGWFTRDVAAWPELVRGTVLGVSLLLLGYASAAVLLLLAHGATRPLRVRRPRTDRPSGLSWTGGIQRWSLVAAVTVAFATAFSPIGAMAVANTNWDITAGAAMLAPVSARAPGGHRHTLRLSGPTPVSIVQQSDGSWQYVVDGTAETIRGVGYNPWYANLAPTDRAALYNRDFADMRQLGINTIEGWFENQFDGVTLDAAARNGIGVLMPFELNQDLDYTDPAVRANILDRLTAYVNTYKNHPAVRMWAPGNENLHRILYAHWVSQANVPEARAKAEAMAAFIPVVVDRIHELDPGHPVVYRDAEDVYLSWITNGFLQLQLHDGGGDRPWLVYGANIYSEQRLHDVIAAWPSQWPGHPLLISEFAPAGVGPAQRPLGFDQQWQVIRSRPDVVLGGLAYTWATNGPEDLDRVFGLVDPNGVPTDGALAALSAAYLADGGLVADTPASH
jgi:hypothetical protein